MDTVRIDKWLWAARFFKTRTLAGRACELGRIRTHNMEAKPSREIRVGDMLEIRNEGGIFVVEILALSQMRGPATVAQLLYRETEESRTARLQAAEERKAVNALMPQPTHRPSKRDRRHIIKFRGGR
jgi:ribosome-associated heat shock protein Hsp15